MKILVILGFKLDFDGRINNILKNRLDKSDILYKKTNFDLIIVSGGNVEKSTKNSESYVMKEYLIKNCTINPKIILEEKISKNTNENAIETFKIIKKIKNVTNVTIITSKFHLERVKLVFTYFYKNMFNLNFKSSNDITDSKDITLKQLYVNEKIYINDFLKIF